MNEGEFIELATQGDDTAVRRALAAGATLASARGPDRVSVVSKLVYAGRLELARELAAARSDLDVFEASCVGDVTRVEALVAGANSFDVVSPDGFSPLGYAAYFVFALAPANGRGSTQRLLNA